MSLSFSFASLVVWSTWRIVKATGMFQKTLPSIWSGRRLGWEVWWKTKAPSNHQCLWRFLPPPLFQKRLQWLSRVALSEGDIGPGVKRENVSFLQPLRQMVPGTCIDLGMTPPRKRERWQQVMSKSSRRPVDKPKSPSTMAWLIWYLMMRIPWQLQCLPRRQPPVAHLCTLKVWTWRSLRMRMSLVMVMELMDPDDFFRWNIMTKAAWIASSKPWIFDQHTPWQWKSMTTEKVMRNPSFLQICLQHTASHTCCIDALLCYDFAVSAPWIECEPRVGSQVCLLKKRPASLMSKEHVCMSSVSSRACGSQWQMSHNHKIQPHNH